MVTGHPIESHPYGIRKSGPEYFSPVKHVDPEMSAPREEDSRFFNGLNGWGGFLGSDAKRRFDIVMSLLLLIPALPVMLLVMLAIWLSTFGREPVFYHQRRVGLNSEIFTLKKFRSMQANAEAHGPKTTAENDRRITRIGRFIRRSRIDELPQLFQVLYGEMSLVGPRPERPEFVAHFSQQIEGYALRHKVKPGVTGLAQVNYGYGETIEDATFKLLYDLSYIRQGCVRLDLMILLRTIPVVLTGSKAR